MEKKYAVRLFGDPVWMDNGDEEVFDSEEQAIVAMELENKECREAVRAGYMEDWDGFEDYRIVEVWR